MLTPQLTETIAMKQCHDCGMELRERDKFCRRCGINQRLRLSSSTELQPKSERETRRLPVSGAMHQSFSGPLVSAVTVGMSQRTTSLRKNRWAMLLIGALVAVPLWLMILLLSPLEAFGAAKAIARQV